MPTISPSGRVPQWRRGLTASRRRTIMRTEMMTQEAAMEARPYGLAKPGTMPPSLRRRPSRNGGEALRPREADYSSSSSGSARCRNGGEALRPREVVAGGLIPGSRHVAAMEARPYGLAKNAIPNRSSVRLAAAMEARPYGLAKSKSLRATGSGRSLPQWRRGLTASRRQRADGSSRTGDDLEPQWRRGLTASRSRHVQNSPIGPPRAAMEARPYGLAKSAPTRTHAWPTTPQWRRGLTASRRAPKLRQVDEHRHAAMEARPYGLAKAEPGGSGTRCRRPQWRRGLTASRSSSSSSGPARRSGAAMEARPYGLAKSKARRVTRAHVVAAMEARPYGLAKSCSLS